MSVCVLLASSASVTLHDPPTWRPQSLDPEEGSASPPTLTSTPVRSSADPTDNYGPAGDVYTCFCFQVGLVRDVQRYALILNDDGEQPEEEAPPRRASAGRSGET